MSKNFLMLVLLAALMLPASAFAGHSSSLTEFMYENHLYKLVYGNWYDAEADAEAWGGHLVTINDRAEEDWLKDTFGTCKLFWTGFTDKDEEGDWGWVSGEPVTYTNWSRWQPDNGGLLSCLLNEDFAVMNYGCGDKWNDLSYWANCKGIAEKVAPEPVSAGLFLLGGAALAMRRRMIRG